MKSPDIKEWNKQKNEDLFAVSDQILGLFGYFTDFQLCEMRLQAEHALTMVDHLFAGSIAKVGDEQMELLAKSASYAANLHLKSRSNIEVIQEKIQSNSDECVHKSVDLLAEFIEEGDRKIPVGAKQIADALRVVSESGDRAFMVGQTLAHIAAQNSDQIAEKYLIQELLE